MSLRPRTFEEALARKIAADKRRRTRQAKAIAKNLSSAVKKVNKLVFRAVNEASRKPSGQSDLFKAIAKERANPEHEWDHKVPPHRCEVCNVGMFLLLARNFSHILPKGAYPRWKLVPKNVRIWCHTCHNLWHRVPRVDLVRGRHGNGAQWAKAFTMFDEFKDEYIRTDGALPTP